MRLALLLFLFTALGWPGLAQQDQSQTPPPQNQPSESPAPEQSAPPPSQPAAQPSTPAGTQEAPATEPPPSSAKTHKKKISRKKSNKKRKKAAPKDQAEAASDGGPRRIVVRRGSTSDTGGQLEPGVPNAEVARQRQATEQLLRSTDANLKNIAQRKLSPDQQDMVRQITSYMEQSRSADKEGDLVRARNLALKAHMLSDELARR